MKKGVTIMNINYDFAMKFWNEVFGNVKFARDCFGTWMCRDAYSNEVVSMKDHLGGNKYYDYSWNIDHIRPKASYQNETDADFLNNLEPMHRQNNLQKNDNFPTFEVNGRRYKVVQNYSGGYGIVDDTGKRIDWKKDGRYYR